MITAFGIWVLLMLVVVEVGANESMVSVRARSRARLPTARLKAPNHRDRLAPEAHPVAPALVAQWIEHRSSEPRVGGSNPSERAKC